MFNLFFYSIIFELDSILFDEACLYVLRILHHHFCILINVNRYFEISYCCSVLSKLVIYFYISFLFIVIIHLDSFKNHIFDLQNFCVLFMTSFYEFHLSLFFMILDLFAHLINNDLKISFYQILLFFIFLITN
jgi:hypothetical protein